MSKFEFSIKCRRREEKIKRCGSTREKRKRAERPQQPTAREAGEILDIGKAKCTRNSFCSFFRTPDGCQEARTPPLSLFLFPFSFFVFFSPQFSGGPLNKKVVDFSASIRLITFDDDSVESPSTPLNVPSLWPSDSHSRMSASKSIS